MFLNVHKGNLDELTTKSTLLPEVQRSGVIQHAHAQLFATPVQPSCDSVAWRFSFVLHRPWHKIFVSHLLPPPSPPPPPPLPMALSPLIFFSVMGACFCFLFVGGSWLYQPWGNPIYNRRQNELRHFAQNWAFLRFINFKRRKYCFPPPSPPCNVVPLF